MFLNNFFTKKIKLTEAKAVLDANELEAMIRNSATQRGMDPDVAVRVWRSEGGTAYQSNISRDGKGSEGGKEASYGPFQLYTGGGLGNDYEEKYGVDLRDDNTPEGIQRQIDFALNQAIKKGWGPWNGAAKVNIGSRDGLDNAVAKAYIPPDETVAVQAVIDEPKEKPEYDAFGNTVDDEGFDPDNKKADQAARIAKRQSAEDQKRAELEKSFPDMGKEALPTSLSVKEKELEDAQARLDALTLNGTQKEVAQAQADVKRIEQAVQYNKDVQAGKDVVGGAGTLTQGQAEYAKAKEEALLQGKDDVKSIADIDLDRRAAEAYANQQEGMGNAKLADFARLEAKRLESLKNAMLTKGVTWGQGTLDQQEEKIEKAGTDPAKFDGGMITGKEKQAWEKRNREADEKQKAEGNYTVTDTIDDYRAEVEPEAPAPAPAPQAPAPQAPQAKSYSAPVTSAGGAVKQGSGYSQGGVQKKQATSYSAPVTSAGGAVKQGSGYSQGGVQKPTTPKVDPYPNPGYTGEELRIYNQLSGTQKAKVIGDFEKSKKYTDQQRKNITPRTGPTSIPDAKPRSLLDIKHQQTLSKIEGGKVLVDPAQDLEISKALTKNYPNVQSRNAAIEKLRYTAPSLQDIQKGKPPIVDKSTKLKPGRNTNIANNQIGDAYGVLSKPEVPKVEPVKPVTKGSKQTVGKPVPKVEPVKPVTKGSKQTVGKPVPVKETRDFENWINSTVNISEAPQRSQAPYDGDAPPEKVATSYLGKVDTETDMEKFTRQDNAQQQAALTQNGRQPMYRDQGAQVISQVGARPGDQGKIVTTRTPGNNMVNNVTGDWAQADSKTDSLGQSTTRGGGGYGMGEKTATTQARIASAQRPGASQKNSGGFDMKANAAAIDKAAAKKFADPNDKTTKLKQAEITRRNEKVASDMIKTNANAAKSAVGNDGGSRAVDMGNTAGSGKMDVSNVAATVNQAGNQAAEIAYKRKKSPAVVRPSATAPAPTPKPVATAPATAPAPKPVTPKPVATAPAPTPVKKVVAPPKQATSYSAEQKLREFKNWADDITAIVESVVTEAQFDEAAGKKDACYHKVKSRYKVWPSAYASGALVQCRKKGAKNWGNSKKK